MDIIYITYKQWNTAFRRIEKANINNHGHSLSAASMMNSANDLICEVREDEAGMMVVSDWKEIALSRFRVPPSSKPWVVLRLNDADQVLQVFEYDDMDEARESFDEEVQDLGHRAALLPAWMYEAWEKLEK